MTRHRNYLHFGCLLLLAGACDYRGPGARVTIPGYGPMTDGVAGKYKTKYQVYTVVGEQQQYASKCNASLLPLIVLARLLSSSLPGSWP